MLGKFNKRYLKPLLLISFVAAIVLTILAVSIVLGSGTALASSSNRSSDTVTLLLGGDGLFLEDEKLYYDSLPPASEGPSEYKTVTKWNKNPVTYSFGNCPRALDCTQAHQALREAIEAWDAASGITLNEVSGIGDIYMWWASGCHGDGNCFDGPGGVLAHAFFPYPYLGALAGDVHFDDDEAWVIGSPSGPLQIHLKTVAMHEIGHSLGMDHSENPAALMWAEYNGIRGLHSDDIAGIRSLYGPPNADDTGGGVPPTQPTPEPPSPGPSSVKATSTTWVRMRSGPGTNYSQVGSIPINTTVPVYGRNAASDWLYVEYDSQRGWSAAWLFILDGNLADVPVVDEDGGGAPPSPPGGPTPVPTQPPSPGDPSGVTARANTNIRIRSGPGTNYNHIGTVLYQSVVPVLGRNQSMNWIFIEYNGIQGWIAAWLCTINGDLSSVPVMDSSLTSDYSLESHKYSDYFDRALLNWLY